MNAHLPERPLRSQQTRTSSRWRSRKTQSRRRLLRAEQLEPRLALAYAELEPNENRLQATVLPSSTSHLSYEVTGSIASLGDQDYFKVTLQAGQSIYADYYWTGLREIVGSVEILDDQGRLLTSKHGAEGGGLQVAKDGDYFVRTTAASDLGTFLGNYSLRVTMQAGIYSLGPLLLEVEPNDSFATAQTNQFSKMYAGTLPSAADLDYYAFNAFSGYALTVNFKGFPEERPAVVVYGPDGVELARDNTGAGVSLLAPMTGYYRVAVTPDRDSGPVTGPYMVDIDVWNGPYATLPAATSLATAPILTSTDLTLRGSFTQVNSPRFFGFDVTSLEFPSVSVYASGDEIRTTLYNDRGQVITSFVDTSFNMRYLERPPALGRYYVSLEPLNTLALGMLTVFVDDYTTVSQRRNTPLFLLDFDQQKPKYVGKSWISTFAVPEAKDFIQGTVESRYSAWDVEVTRTLPLGFEYVGQGFGNFDLPGASGQSIGGSAGVERAEGDSVTDCNMTSWTSLSYGCTTTLNHEYAHGVGLSHPRSIQTLLAYDNAEEVFAAGTSYPFFSTESRIPHTFQNNIRDYLDWSLSAGYQVVEASGNDSRLGSQSLTARIDEMNIDLIRGESASAGARPNEVKLLNLNGDAWLDLVHTEDATDQITVRLGTGPGKFNAGIRYTPGFDLPEGLSTILATGDVNLDGRDDLAVAGRSAGTVLVYLGNSDGTLSAPLTIPAGVSPQSVELADLNGDGRADLITGNTDARIGVHLSNGDGTFAARQEFATTGGSAADVLAVRLDGNSTCDIVTANGTAGTVDVFLGTGTGSFAAPASYATFGTTSLVQSSDVNGDGQRDLVVLSSGSIGVLRGNANGTVGAVTLQYLGISPTSFTTGDFNADGYSDVVVAINTNGYGTYFAPGSATGSFGTRALTYPYAVGGMTTGDLNGDGVTDLLEATYNNYTLTPTFGQANDPSNDRAVVFGTISGPADKDNFAVTVTAGQRFAFDIESAEFQYPLDAIISLYDASGTLLAQNDDALDRDTGIVSVDPYLTYTFSTAGTYYAEITSKSYTAGSYRFKVSPSTSWDDDGPKVIGTVPAGQANVESRRQIVLFLNDQLDPATLTAANIVVSGTNSGVRSGTALFDPFEAVLIWTADAALPVDTYTVTLNGAAGGIADLKGNLLDGETDGTFQFPEVSGNNATGGNFSFGFNVTSLDNTPATATATYSRNPYNRGQFTITFSDEVSKTFAQLTARGAGPDATFNTADDRLLPLDTVQDLMDDTTRITAFTRGVPDPDFYRIEGTVMDAAGHNVVIAATATVAVDIPNAAMFTDSSLTQNGFVGSYVNANLRSYAPQDDWRVTQTISGTRTDAQVDFLSHTLGSRASVGVTGGSDTSWGNFSVQWDGYLQVPAAGTKLQLKTINNSRMWIDYNNDGVFEQTGPEFINNFWGQGASSSWTGVYSSPFTAPGAYKVRIQYEHEYPQGSQIYLGWVTPDLGGQIDNVGNGPSVIDVNVQPGSTLGTGQPYSFEVTFSGAIDPATLTTANFKLRQYSDASYSGSGTTVFELDNAIAYDPTTHKATFQTAQRLSRGYYILELNGDAGGIADTRGRLLDGEFMNSYIAGNNQPMHLQDTPSGNGIAGGDYVASFNVYNYLAEVTVVPTDVFEDGANNIFYTFYRSGSVAEAGQVQFSVGGTATFGSDYTQSGATAFNGTSGTVTFPPGVTQVIVTLDPVADSGLESDETIVLTLTPADPYYLGPATSGTATLRNDDTAPLQVASFVPTSTGATLTFNRDLDPSTLNLYDILGNTLGPADIVLQGATVGVIRGSAVVETNLRQVTFIATNGRLPVDDYTLTLRSAANGFRDATQTLLDGDSDGQPGVNYVRNFSVAADVAGTVALRLPNFARGPQQPVNVPANATSGLPISFSDGGGITSASFELRYNPALLNINGAFVAPGLPAGANVTINSTPGVAVIQFTSPTPLAAGTTRFVDLQTSVPTNAPYRSKHVLDLTSISINGGAIPARDDDGLHVVAFFGDTTASGNYSSSDASQIARLAVGLESGIQQFKLLDPVIIADITGNGGFSASDTTRMQQAVVGIVTGEVPMPLPNITLIAGGPDPKLSIPVNLVAAPGEALTIPVHIDSIVDLTGDGLESAELVIHYDANVLEVTSATLGSLVTDRGWSIASRIDSLAGRALITLGGQMPLEGKFLGELVQLHATVKADASGGSFPINLAASAHDVAIRTQLNEGWLTLIPAPTDAANDPGVDGLLTISGAPTASADVPTARLIDNRLLITATAHDDHILVTPLGVERVRVRVNDRLLGSFAIPQGIVIDAQSGADFVYLDPGLPASMITSTEEPDTELVLAGGHHRLTIATFPESNDEPVVSATGPSQRDLALLQLLDDWLAVTGAETPAGPSRGSILGRR